MSFLLAEPVEFPGEVVEDDELEELEADLEPEELVAFEEELDRISSAEREAAEESDTIKLA